jgi:hypothetical protein
MGESWAAEDEAAGAAAPLCACAAGMEAIAMATPNIRRPAFDFAHDFFMSPTLPVCFIVEMILPGE